MRNKLLFGIYPVLYYMCTRGGNFSCYDDARRGIQYRASSEKASMRKLPGSLRAVQFEIVKASRDITTKDKGELGDCCSGK